MRVFWPWPQWVAHRGGGRLAPENTLAGLRQARASGFAGVEFDAMLAGDGIPILMHDDVLGRTVTGSGSIAQYAAIELCAMDAGAWFGPTFKGEPVPTLTQAIRLCAELDLWMNVEIKPVPGFEHETGVKVGEEVARYFAAGQSLARYPVLSSFSEVALRGAMVAAPYLPRAWLCTEVPPDWRERLVALGCRALHVRHTALTSSLIAQVHAAGYGVLAYTVNTAVAARTLFDWGLDCICTDDLTMPAMM